MKGIQLAIKYSLLSLFVAPTALAFAVLRGDVMAQPTLLERMRDYGFAYTFSALSFGIELLIAGAVSGFLVSAVAQRSRALRAAVSVVAPIVLLPISIVVSFITISTGVPLIQNGNPYVLAGAMGGVFVGLLTLRAALHLDEEPGT